MLTHPIPIGVVTRPAGRTARIEPVSWQTKKASGVRRATIPPTVPMAGARGEAHLERV